MNIRANAFWLIDRLKGGKVGTYYNEVLSSIKGLGTDNSSNLDNILNWAVNKWIYKRKFICGKYFRFNGNTS